MTQHAVIIDFSFVFHVSRHRALDAGPEYNFIDSLVYHFEGKLRTIKRELGKLNIVGADFVFAEDRLPVRKIALLPSYKNQHTDLSDEKNKLKQHLLNNGYKSRFCYAENEEADDVIATLVRVALENDVECIVCSCDMDLWQLIQPRVQVYNPIKQKMVTDADIEKAFKCRPIHIPLVKALWGDSGDCVPNVVPRMQKQLLPIIKLTDGRLDTFKTMLEERKYHLTEKCYAMYLKAQHEIERNYQLVFLDDQCTLVWE